MKKYQKIAVGGTFDRIHIGHKQLLLRAFDLSETVVIGITSDNFPKDKIYSQLILPYHERKAEVEYFLEQEKLDSRSQIVSIDDLYGTTLEDKFIEAVLVTTQTKEGASKINKKRAELNLPRLSIELVDLILDKISIPVSSTRIRQGVINHQGEVFVSLFNKDIELKNDQKVILKAPMGQLAKENELKHCVKLINPVKTIIVGDATLKTCLKEGIKFDYAVIDGQTKRKFTEITDFKPQTIINTYNPAGTITHEAIDGLRRLFKEESGLLKIEGEEDLLTLACILLLPLNSVVLYGQPDQGVVIVRVDESTKDRWYRFLKETDKIGT